MSAFTGKNKEELTKVLAEKREALRVFRFGAGASKTKDVKIGRTLRREIAQVLTECNRKSA